jgi:hypothetical protein
MVDWCKLKVILALVLVLSLMVFFAVTFLLHQQLLAVGHLFGDANFG